MIDYQVSTKDVNNYTLLQYAVLNNLPDFVRLLLEFGFVSYALCIFYQILLEKPYFSGPIPLLSLMAKRDLTTAEKLQFRLRCLKIFQKCWTS